MMEFYIRRARTADAPAIIASINTVCAEGGYFYTPHYVPTPAWEAVLHNPQAVSGHLLLVAEAGETLVGVARLFPLPGDLRNGRAGESGIFVLPLFRGQKIGTALMRELLRRAATLEYTRVVLTVLSANQRAIRLYRKFGFVKEGRQQRDYALIGEQEEWIMARSVQHSDFTGVNYV
ncbi:MAG: GNAT family N-acetyltransferase [Chloroflexota bacterium]|nr:GNAT family N-acetyltransferase [Chloroflexota bacterium]